MVKNMSKLKRSIITEENTARSYPKFKQINGKHPLQSACPDSFMLYKARQRKGGKVAVFNFDLAKELGLIPLDHPNEITAELEESILNTFSIVIINEFDEMNGKKFPDEEIKPNKYMATRYLQLQHPCKKGTTSGDGRSIWNGHVKNKGRSWDISSCGTGATALSPATHIQKKYFETGDPTISYGCGYSEKDEGLAAIFFSEIFNRNKVATERCLGIIEFKNDISINIRVHENLIRPSHMFNHLKQGNLEALKNIVDYYIDRQIKNKIWNDVPKKGNDRYEYFLKKEAEVFAKMSASFEDEYIFCWLDWDGDNILMDGAIIDYGSIRQFGLYHDEYRYDDVQRYSTSIKEQKQKARYTVQTFAQLVDFLKTGKRKQITDFKSHKILKHFDKKFSDEKNRNLLHKLGFNDLQKNYLLKSQAKLIEDFKKTFAYFERSKSIVGVHEVADGINWSAIFCMRDILRELPQIILSREDILSKAEFMEIIASSYATKEDLEMTPYRSKMINLFQKDYMNLVNKVAKHFNVIDNKILLELSMRSSVINKYDRVTGDSISTVIDKVMKRKPKFSAEELYNVLTEFAEYQNLDPERKISKGKDGNQQSKFIKKMFKIVRDYREGL
jgi:hypothetical protein